MCKIIRDVQSEDAVWCLCNDYNEYLQFAKDLYCIEDEGTLQYLGRNNRWFKNDFEWCYLFEAIPTDKQINTDWSNGTCNPLIDTEYRICCKPKDKEYPVIVHYERDNEYLLWVSLNKLKK